MPQDNFFDILTGTDESEIASLRIFGTEKTGSDNFFDILTGYEEEKQKASGSALWDYIPDVIKKGYNESITGMAQQLATGEAPFDLEDYSPGVLGDIGAGVVSFFMPADIGLFAAGGGIGGQAAKKAGKLALRLMI